MFVASNQFRAVRGYFSDQLKGLYSSSELKLILKYLYLKHFDASPADFILADEQRLSESDLLFFHQALKRLRNQEPFQYVIGEAEFYGLLLKCDHRALIPRPETEELVEWILESKDTIEAALDVCAGSGCIALALKSNVPKAKVYALEYSEDALSLIRENAQQTSLSILEIAADALTADYLELTKTRLDVVVSNPPYIPMKDKERMEANVLEFEPEMALFVEDEDPLLFYREIALRSKTVLKEGGWLYFEIHEDLSKEVKLLLKQLDFVNIELRKDLQGRDRMMRGQVLSCNP